MHSYRIVLPDEFFEEVRPGALDHWVGETVPLRSSDRQIIGEATVKAVESREDGSVSVVVESRHDRITLTELSDVARLLAGGNAMSFSIKREDLVIPHQPRRNDDVARWLKARRDEYTTSSPGGNACWHAIDALLDEYRARADYGFDLDHDMSELEGRW
jgi:hypothetical protein